MDYAKIIESLRGLIKDDSTTEQVEAITSIVKDVETAKTENDDLIIKHEELCQKYIKSLTQTTFKDSTDEKSQEQKPMTFDECVAQVMNK